MACGLPHYGRGDLELGRAEIAAAQQHYAGLRRFGAATLDLAWIAAGRFDAYWERDLSPWDMAAGIVLVREAGGFVSDLDGGENIMAKSQIAAGNDTMHQELASAPARGRQGTGAAAGLCKALERARGAITVPQGCGSHQRAAEATVQKSCIFLRPRPCLLCHMSSVSYCVRYRALP